MKKVVGKVGKLFSGQIPIEYSLIVVLVSVVLISTLTTLGTGGKETFSQESQKAGQR